MSEREEGGDEGKSEDGVKSVLWGGRALLSLFCFAFPCFSPFSSFLPLGQGREGGREGARNKERWEHIETRGLCRSACAPQTKLWLCSCQRFFSLFSRRCDAGGSGCVWWEGREGGKGPSFHPSVFTCAWLYDSPESKTVRKTRKSKSAKTSSCESSSISNLTRAATKEKEKREGSGQRKRPTTADEQRREREGRSHK